ncbi:FAD binding domain protein [Penicillium maclennaniae]|uniref:FAD binding domain protein n=1 Tax=Penicillium maclennaniae TaxID=1343394 RepID=UPI002542035E|nr:FAD binding domain protein [Penicillium maclennaniae]KAJ5677176.1 FAD binding domain protein [Penicillium maclennaniae]
MAPFFTNGTCDPFHPVSKPCTTGNLVHYAVNVSQPEHVSKAMMFATTHQIRFVVRTTGHDYNGKSTGAGALAVWMHNLKDGYIKDHNDKHYRGKPAKLGACIQGIEAYRIADAHGLRILSGACPSVENNSDDLTYKALELYNSQLSAIVDKGIISMGSISNTSFQISPMTAPDIPVEKLNGGKISLNGMNVSKNVSDDVDNAVLTARRDAITHAYLKTPWKFNSPEEMLSNQNKNDTGFCSSIAEFGPAYLNEADFRQPNWKTAFYGDNYEALRQIKAKYDPHSIFYGVTAVGSDEWIVSPRGCMCRA